MLIKLATWASAFTALLFIVPPPLEHEVHVKMDDINDAVSTDQGLLAMFRSGSHRGVQPVARGAGALHHRLQVAGFSTAVGAAVLLVSGCWLLASALTATQRKLLTALIAREAFDVLMLLASWLSQGDAAIAQLTAAVLSLLAGAVGAYQHLRYTSVRWADCSWSILLCIASIALGLQSCGIKFEVVDAGAGAIKVATGNPDDGSGLVVACVVIFFVILGLGGGGFAAYWFILRQKHKRASSPLGTPAPAPVPDPEMNASYISTKSETDEARQVSKPVLLEVNGAAVDEKSTDSDDTIDESDEEQTKKPALPTQPKPPVPVVSPHGTASSPKPPPPKPKQPKSPAAADFLDDDSDYHDGS